MEAPKLPINISYALQGISPVECTNSTLNLWRIRWDFESIIDENYPNVNFVKFKECQFSCKPTIEEIKSIITLNSEKEYNWDEYNVYLQ